jgi:myo-inositol-1(or 4)-monophosphatase
MKSPLSVAIKAAEEAGEILLEAYNGRRNTVTYKAHREPVSLADYASNDVILRHLTRAFPDDVIVSEEVAGSVHDLRKGKVWIVDPLDGTSNFIAHIPLFAVTIARMENGVATVAVIYDPVHGDMYTAERGNGAKLNGRSMHVSNRDVTIGAMFFAGRGYRDMDRMRHGRIIYALERRTPYFRRLGSAAIMLAGVACGSADAVILTGSKPWDTVAGGLLVEEAGGKISDYNGRTWSPESIDLVATNKQLHPHIIAVTKKERPTRAV